MLIKGFRFGAMLQIAIGPICLMIFNTAASGGFWMGIPIVLGVAVIDGLYIALSGVGVAAIINRENVKAVIKIFGSVILVLFGANIIAGAFDFALLPSFSLFSNVTGRDLFVQGLLLTASNPMAILFWGGVFSTQVAENKLNKKQIFVFGLGCVLATLVCLSLVALLGSILRGFLSPAVIRMLKIASGCLVIFFGIRLAVKK